MTDKKKKYLAPEITVIEIEAADIIATSTTGYNEGPVTIGGGSGIDLDEGTW